MKTLRALFLLLIAAAPIAAQTCPPGAKSCPNPSASAIPSRPTPKFYWNERSGLVAPWSTAVRIKSDLGKLVDIGSGTIIDGSPELALVMTAAHVVSHPGKPILVEVFGPSLDRSNGSVGPPIGSFAGTVVDRDEGLDVGLVSFVPGRRLLASAIVPPGWSPSPSEVLCSVGCSLGAEPTGVAERFALTMEYASKKGFYRSIECDREPPQGRSGGGLFDKLGRLVGVLNFADTVNHRGLYAGTESLRSILRRNARVDLADGTSASRPDPQPDPNDAQGNAPTPPPAPSWPGGRVAAQASVVPEIVATGAVGTGLIGLIVWASLRRRNAGPPPDALAIHPEPSPFPFPLTGFHDLVPLLVGFAEKSEAEARAARERDDETRRNAELGAEILSLIQRAKATPTAPESPPADAPKS
jgi:hypothetical protein